MKKTMLTYLALFFFLAASSLSAQEPAQRPMREELIRLNYADEATVSTILSSVLSPQGRFNLRLSRGLVSLKDYPENVEKALALVKNIDVKPADMVFTVQLILASASEDVKTEESLAANPLLKELRSFLRYKNFSLLDTSLVRAMDRQRSEVMLGTKETEFSLYFEPVYISEGKTDLIRVKIDLSQRWESTKTGGGTESHMKSLIESNLSLKPGESTVVGVSKMGGSDKGLILIISGKIIK